MLACAIPSSCHSSSVGSFLQEGGHGLVITRPCHRFANDKVFTGYRVITDRLAIIECPIITDRGVITDGLVISDGKGTRPCRP